MNLKKPLICLYTLLLLAGCGKKESPTEPEVNRPPVIERIVANPEEIFTEDVSRLECFVSDEDNDHLYYNWDSDGGYFSDFNNERITWHSPTEIGTYHITVEVDDKKEDGKVLDNKSISVVSRFDTSYVSENGFIEEVLPDTNMNILDYDKLVLCDTEWYNYHSEICVKFDIIRSQKRIKTANIILLLEENELILDENKEVNGYIFEIKEPWTRDNLTWNNRPDKNLFLTPLQTFTIPSVPRYPYEIIIRAEESLRELIEYWQDNPSENYGIRMHILEEGFKTFTSKEGAEEEGNIKNAPTLIREYE